MYADKSWQSVLYSIIILVCPRIISINRISRTRGSLCYMTLHRLARVRRSRLSMNIALAPRAAHTRNVLTAR